VHLHNRAENRPIGAPNERDRRGDSFLQQRLQVLAGEASRFLHHLFRRADGDDFAAVDAAVGSEVDDPVGGLDDVQVVLIVLKNSGLK
jgi:DNA-binding MltR family transcriptional regulator